jgi:CheY-like chemotaxis protein
MHNLLAGNAKCRGLKLLRACRNGMDLSRVMDLSLPRTSQTIEWDKRAFNMGTILIVDDHCASREALRQLVEKNGRAVVTAGDGEEALNRVRSIPPPTLILLDLSMPRMNGWEFLHNKTADPTIAGIPTIVVSGSSSELPAGGKRPVG